MSQSIEYRVVWNLYSLDEWTQVPNTTIYENYDLAFDCLFNCSQWVDPQIKIELQKRTVGDWETL